MGNCGNKIRMTCTGNKQYGECVEYQSNVNTQSSLTESSCRSIEDTTQDVYNQLQDIQDSIELSELGQTCLTYVQEEGKTIVKNALLGLESKVCELQERIVVLENAAICDMKITDCGLTFPEGCLSLPCDEIETLGQLLQSLINKTCE